MDKILRLVKPADMIEDPISPPISAWEEDDGIPFDEKMETLTTDLDGLFKESNELEKNIRQNLKDIGFEFWI